MSWVRLSVRLSVAVLFLVEFGYIGLSTAQAFNNTPIFIESIYESRGERCVIQEAAFSTDESAKKLLEQLETPFNDTAITLPPGTISNDDPSGPSGKSFSASFSYVQNCSQDDSTCTLELRLERASCGSPTEENPSRGQHYIKYANIHATGISVVRILSDDGDIIKEVSGENLVQARQFGYLSEYKANTVVFEYKISDPERFGYDFIVDACCVK